MVTETYSNWGETGVAIAQFSSRPQGFLNIHSESCWSLTGLIRPSSKELGREQKMDTRKDMISLSIMATLRKPVTWVAFLLQFQVSCIYVNNAAPWNAIKDLRYPGADREI